MAQPFDWTNTFTFDQDQRVLFKADYWDTPYTSKSAGLGFTHFSIKDLPAFQSATKTTRSDIETNVLTDTAITSSALGYSSGTNYIVGAIPSMYMYWGAGALPGVTTDSRMVLKFDGYVKSAGTVTLVFGGRGYMQLHVNGAASPTISGNLKEPVPDGDMTTFSNMLLNAGYAGDAITLAKGDHIEIYYWHAGESWGGIFGKVLPGNFETGYDRDTFFTALREAPIISSSYLGLESSGDPLSSIQLPYLKKISVNRDLNSASNCTIEVPLVASDADVGYIWDSATRSLKDVANPSTIIIKEDRRISVTAGYASPGDYKDGSGDLTSPELYPRFTGHITKIEPTANRKSAIIEASGFEAKLLNTFDENYPDRVSYHAFGYLRREGSSEPVYPITAYDNWPMEYALADMACRAGVDSEALGKSAVSSNPAGSRKQAYTATEGVLKDLERYFQARSIGDPDLLVRLERNTRYGNVGLLHKDYLPDDDEYLFAPEVRDRLWDRTKAITDQYGFDCHFDASGNYVLRTRNNPHAFAHGIDTGTVAGSNSLVSISTTGISLPADRGLTPSAISGTYLEKQNTDSAWTYVIEGYFGRLDIYAGIGEAANGMNGGIIDVDTEVWNGTGWDPHTSGSVTTYADTDEAFYYDNAVRADGSNASVLTAFSDDFDRYRVTLSPGGIDPSDPQTGGADAFYRVNGVAIFFHDPMISWYPNSVSTLQNALSMNPKADKSDQRNHVIVVGARKAVVTDSGKFNTEADTNPNNPGREFHVSVAADQHSIYNPNSDNFVGAKRMTVIFDKKVSDTDFANWLSTTILYRYRFPAYSVPVEHTALPQLELRDPLVVTDPAQSMFNDVFWVAGYSETWEIGRATSNIEFNGRPEIPSYQPREDIDIDTLFVDSSGDGLGEPVINFEISYKNIYDEALDNLDVEAPVMILPTDRNEAATSSTSQALTYAALPETIYLKGTADVAYTGTKNRLAANMPYRRFFNITSWDANHKPTLNIDFQEADGNSDAYGTTYYQYPSDPGNYTWEIMYKSFSARTGSNPFYDPYSSELGKLVKINFDALVSGRYRVSIWDANRFGGRETPVAWLTVPGGDPLNPEAHWTYMEPGKDVTFYWDGVDNIGIWNRQQGEEYEEIMSGVFGDEPVVVGRGFYAWNDQGTNVLTQIGDAVANNYYPSSGTHIDVRNADYPYFTLGRYNKLFVRVEVINDALYLKDIEAGYNGTRIVDSEDLPAAYNTMNASTRGGVFIWTHLGEPTQVGLTIEEWDTTTEDWYEGTASDYWVSLGASDPIIRNGKPVKITFTPVPRRGKQFNQNNTKVYIKLFRQAHLKATIWDQYWTFFTSEWSGLASNNISNAGNERRLTSHMFHNEDHTIEWADNVFRDGEEIAALEWIFHPEYFRKNFGAGYDEALRYGDFEQLEDLPGRNPANRGGVNREDQSYLTLAYMNYLFYFSAYCQDLSGRRQWGLNREFIDKSKIVTSAWLGASYNGGTPGADTNSYAVDFPFRGGDRYVRRTMFVREWKDTDWASGGSRTPLSPVSLYTITDNEELAFVQVKAKDFDPEAGTFERVSSTYQDNWLDAWSTDLHKVNYDLRWAGSDDGAPTYPSTQNYQILPKQFGTVDTWDFIRGPHTGGVVWFEPSPARDFHPFWKMSIMPAWGTPLTRWFLPADGTWDEGEGNLPYLASGGDGTVLGTAHAQNVLEIPSSHLVLPYRDEGAQDNWFAYAFQEDWASSNTDYYGARLEQSVKGWAEERYQGSIGYSFDYVRQDELDRFDQYRGVWSRSSIDMRDSDFSEFANYWNFNHRRMSDVQPIAAAGVYLLNLGNYDEYILGYQHDKHTRNWPVHYTGKVTNFFDIRFRHEYVWYNDRHFPIAPKGTSLYEYYQEEYTEARHTGWNPYWLSLPRDVRYYDPGAWTGWKDDVTSTDWTADGHLRWKENIRFRGLQDLINIPREHAYDFIMTFPGGLSSGDAFSSGGWGMTATPQLQYWQGKEVYYRISNIFDAGKGEYGYQRLAVGPRTPETSDITMNLTLPSGLKD